MKYNRSAALAAIALASVATVNGSFTATHAATHDASAPHQHGRDSRRGAKMRAHLKPAIANRRRKLARISRRRNLRTGAAR